MLYILGIIVFAAFEWRLKSQLERKGEKRFFAKGNLEIAPCRNYGLIFGSFKNVKHLATVVQSAVVLLFSCFFIPALFSKRVSVGVKLGCSLALAGAFGNVLDRLTRGYVVDYIRFVKCRIQRVAKLVFNLADFMILLGCLFLLLFSFAGDKK